MEISEECRKPTYDLVKKLRARRLRWAGQVLREDLNQSLVKQVLLAIVGHESHDLETNTKVKRWPLLMDAPPFCEYRGAAEAGSRRTWASRVRDLDPVLSNNKKGYRARQVTTTLNASAKVWKATSDVHGGRFMM